MLEYVKVQLEWIEKLDELMKLSGRQLLVEKGTISHEEAKQKAIAEFEKYRKMECCSTRATTIGLSGN